MTNIPRRHFLIGAAGATVATIAAGLIEPQRATAASTPPQPLGEWPRIGMDTRNTCYQPLAGKIDTPVVAARAYLGGTTPWVMAADINVDGKDELLYMTGGNVVAKAADLSDLWTVGGLGPTDIIGAFDLAGDGSLQVVVLGLTSVFALSAVDGSIVWQHDFGPSFTIYSKSMQIAKIDVAKAGLQMVVWPYYSAYGYAFAFDNGAAAGYQIWQTSPAYANPAYLPEVMVGDVDDDGQAEVVIAGYTEISAFAGATGILLDGSGGGWNGRVVWETGPNIDGRNYGQIQLINLDSDAELEVVDLSDSVTLHAAVVQNSATGFSLLWDKFIEYTENHKALRTTVNSVADVDGDGQVEIVCCLFDDTGDNRWHLLVANAVTGLDSPKLNLADRYLRGVQDFDGDGKAELLVSVETAQTPGSQSTVELYAIGSSGNYELIWSLDAAQVVQDPHSDYPVTLSPGSRNGRMEVLRADPLASFVAVAAGTLQGYTYAAGAVTQTWSRPYDGGVLHRLQDLDGDGAAEVLYQTSDGLLRLERSDGSVIGQTQLAGLAGTATVASLNGTSQNSLIVPGFGVVNVFNFQKNSRTLTKSWWQPGHGEMVYLGTLESVPAADLDGDGRRELVFVDSVDSHTRMRAVQGSGNQVWEHVFEDLPAPTLSGPNGAYTWTFGDFSGHDGLDIYVGANRAGYNTEVSRILNGLSGALLASRDDGPGHVGAEFGPWTGSAAVFDVDGDGIDNIVFLAADVTYNINGTNTDGVKIVNGHLGLYHTPIIGDIDGDGLPEILMTAGFNYLDAIDLDSSGTGSTLWQVETAPGELFGRRSALADVDGDGVMELATLSDSGVLSCRNAATGAIKWTFPLPGSGLAPNVIAVDIDGDGKIEYVVGTDDGTICAIDASSKSTTDVTIIGEIEAFDTAAAWDEFTSVAINAEHVVGSNDLTTVRPWIGYSSGTGDQRLTFNDLKIGQAYLLTIYPAFYGFDAVGSGKPFTASVGAGEAAIEGGATYLPTTSGYQTQASRWDVKFIANSTSLSIDLGNGLTSGIAYLYFNWAEFASATVGERLKWTLAIGHRLGDIIAADIDGDGRSELVVTAEDGYLYVIGQKANGTALAFVTPAGGATVSGTIPVTVSLSGQGLVAYNLRVDSAGLQYFNPVTAGDKTFQLDTTTLTNGVHTLLATATDSAGNKTTITEKITVNNRTALAFVTPAGGATVSGTIPVTVSLSGQGLVAYNLRVDSAGLQYFNPVTAGDKTFQLDTTTLTNGVHTLLATATDSAGNKTTITEKITVNN